MKVEKWKSTFQETLQSVEFSNLEGAKSKLLEILGKAERFLTGVTCSKYLAELTEVRDGDVDKSNIIFFRWMLYINIALLLSIC